MHRTTRTILWIAAGIVALILAITTLHLAARSRAQAIIGETVYLDDRGNVVKLYQAPDVNSPVVAALTHGSPVTVLGLDTRGDQAWVLVQKGNSTAGWTPANRISRDPP